MSEGPAVGKVRRRMLAVDSIIAISRLRSGNCLIRRRRNNRGVMTVVMVLWVVQPRRDMKVLVVLWPADQGRTVAAAAATELLAFTHRRRGPDAVRRRESPLSRLARHPLARPAHEGACKAALSAPLAWRLPYLGLAPQLALAAPVAWPLPLLRAVGTGRSAMHRTGFRNRRGHACLRSWLMAGLGSRLFRRISARRAVDGRVSLFVRHYAGLPR